MGFNRHISKVPRAQSSENASMVGMVSAEWSWRHWQKNLAATEVLSVLVDADGLGSSRESNLGHCHFNSPELLGELQRRTPVSRDSVCSIDPLPF